MAAERSGSISGYVRSSSGEPQVNALVEIFGSADRTLTVFTDAAGHYTATGLLPGFYSLRVVVPAFLPGLREKIGLRAGAALSVNVTLSTLLDVMQLGPAHPAPADDDWKWTLRSAANRPILRIFDPALTGETQDHELRGTLTFLAGSAADGYGYGSDMSTGFTLERSIFTGGQINFSGNVGYGEGLPAAVLRAGYSTQLPNGSTPSMALTVRRFAAADPNLHNAALQALSFSAGDDLNLGDILEVKLGSELQAIQFLGHVTAFRPYGTADYHLSPNTVLEYQYATSRPQMRDDKGSDSAPSDLSDADPRVSLLAYAPKIEHARHQEVSLSQRNGKTSVQVAVFTDHVSDTVLTGTGDVTSAGGFLLPDLSSGTFSYGGNTLRANGVRLVLQRKVNSDLSATFDYSFGGVLDLARPDVSLQQAQSWLTTERRHSMGAKLSASLPHTHTRCVASYRWVSGSALTPVDMFNASPGQSDPYLNLFVHQPIPSMGFLPAHLEAVIDLRNLLAQGYVPVLAQDGQTVYLVQAARSVRGGLTFSF
ncbi:MAG: TonB-dependent receptor [Candidatus Sulfotelmatobacter sp.]